MVAFCATALIRAVACQMVKVIGIEVDHLNWLKRSEVRDRLLPSGFPVRSPEHVNDVNEGTTSLLGLIVQGVVLSSETKE